MLAEAYPGVWENVYNHPHKMSRVDVIMVLSNASVHLTNRVLKGTIKVDDCIGAHVILLKAVKE